MPIDERPELRHLGAVPPDPSAEGLVPDGHPERAIHEPLPASAKVPSSERIQRYDSSPTAQNPGS